MNDAIYQVFETQQTEPEPSLVLPSVPGRVDLPDATRKSANSGYEFAFWGMFLIFGFIVWLVQVRWNIDGTASGFVCLALGVAIPWGTYFVIRQRRIGSIRRRLTVELHSQIVDQAKARHETEILAIRSRRGSQVENAKALSHQLNTFRSESVQLFDGLEPWKQNVAAWLAQADREFDDRAFGPFWDAIENAANGIGALNDNVIALGHKGERYYSGLASFQHNFPSFPVDVTQVPNLGREIELLRTLVRKGQTDFQFANIWEHRQTRAVLIAGFTTLGSALQHLGSTLETSISGLKGAIASDNARLVHEHIRTRESMEHQHELSRHQVSENAREQLVALENLKERDH